MSDQNVSEIAPPKMVALAHGVEAGISWATVEAPMYGAVNGYVRVPDGHPWAGLYYDYIPADVSGGLTYSGDSWIGFDTLHSGDYWPDAPDRWDSDGATRWTADLVATETKRLARQVAEVGAKVHSPDYQLGFDEAMRRVRAAVEAVGR